MLFANLKNNGQNSFEARLKVCFPNSFFCFFMFFSQLMILSSWAKGNHYANIRNYILIGNLKKPKKQNRKWKKTHRGSTVWAVGRGSPWKPELTGFHGLPRASTRASTGFQRASTGFHGLPPSRKNQKNQKNEKNRFANYVRGSDFLRKRTTPNYS